MQAWTTSSTNSPGVACIAVSTDLDELRAALNSGRATYYAGFDPTAPGLHIGHLALLVTCAGSSSPGTGRSAWSVGPPG